MNHLYYGDNLAVLRDRKQFPDACVDLIYLDPPFNSNASYNQLFKGPDGKTSAAQIHAFDDTWTWDDMVSGQALIEVKQRGPDAVARMLDAMVQFLGKNAMTAYLCMMAVRLVELHRVLKPTGSLYLHCDPTASHYLKILLDAVFGAKGFNAEIIWQRTATHNDAKRWPWLSDTLLCYAKSPQFHWSPLHRDQSAEDVEKRYRFTDENGRRYRLGPMDAPAGGGMSAINKKTGKPNGWYEWMGYAPPVQGWRYSPATMQELHDDGLIYYPEDKTKRLAKKLFLDESKGALVGNIWTDIPPLQASARERLGYPTQKPVALLERILNASSNPGDVVLDPFCGCGTTVHAAQNLGRQWIGIDVTPIAVNLIIARLFKEFGSEVEYTVSGFPADLDGAREMFARDTSIKKEFEMWACGLIRAEPRDSGKKGADGGVDGTFWFGAEHEHRAIVSVKGGKKVSVQTVRELSDVVRNQNASVGIYLTLETPTKPMLDWAGHAGTVIVEGFGPISRIQIVTIEDAMRLGPRAANTPLRNPVYFRGKKTDRSGEKQTKMDL